MMSRTLHMLGTGNAMVTQCYNTCFLIHTEKGYFLTDAGGGNTILRKLEEAGVQYEGFHHMFVTHGHTDHILGVIWVIRKIASLMAAGRYNGDFYIYCHDVVKHMLLVMSEMMLKKKDFSYIGTRIHLDELQDGDPRVVVLRTTLMRPGWLLWFHLYNAPCIPSFYTSHFPKFSLFKETLSYFEGVEVKKNLLK